MTSLLESIAPIWLRVLGSLLCLDIALVGLALVLPYAQSRHAWKCAAYIQVAVLSMFAVTVTAFIWTAH